MSRAAAWRSAVTWTLVGLVALVAALSRLRLDALPASSASNLRQLWWYWLASAMVWVGLTAIWIGLGRERLAAEKASDFRWSALLVCVVAVAVRAAVLALHAPELSHDVYRYVFDGR